MSLLAPFSSQLFPEIQLFAIEIPLFDDFGTFSELSNNLATTEIGNHQAVDYGFWIFSIYALGVVSFLWRFFQTTFRLIKLKKAANNIVLHNTTVYSAQVAEVFSYFHWIFVPSTKATSVDECIITHEKAHVFKLHSVDVVLTELFIAFSWCNPLAYSFRKSLKSVHEFQADAYVLTQQKVKKSSYLQLLLMSLEPKNTNPAYNYFSHPTLKKRIEMITKSSSKNKLKFTYILVLPLIALVFMAFKNEDSGIILDETSPTVLKILGEIPSAFPVQNGTIKDISSEFGVVRKHPKLKNKTPHGGIDIKAKKGTPIIATAMGTVLKAKDEGKWGNLIVISHASGFETWYAHLEGFNTKAGTHVAKGDIIGYVGSTGLSTAPHLHYEVRQDGKRLNPMKYITE
ncbi:MAG: peptidoglycan DD-metalloendopeptidase family protein [Kordia sp.]|uniref:peptidoglycan DD-metalloendopeptidase family protein n=1 Tax=Kordia sp. TaxID=1965332 RepID=UPI00385E399C